MARRTAATLLGIAVATAMPSSAASQTTWLDRRAELSALENVTDAHVPLKLRVVDDRRFQADQFPLEGLETLVMEMTGADDSATLLAETDFPSGVLTVGYYGLYRTGGGSWGVRFFGDLEIQPQRREQTPLETKVSEDRILGRDEPRGSGRIAAQESLNRAIEDELRKAFEEIIDVVGSEFREVVVFGRAPIDSGSPEAVMDAAVLDALRRGLELAWGVDIANTVRIDDFGVAEVETVRRGTGAVRAWQVLDDYTTVTEDRFLTVLVRAVLMQPN